MRGRQDCIVAAAGASSVSHASFEGGGAAPSSFENASRLRQNVCAGLASILLCAIILLAFGSSLTTGALQAMIAQPATALLEFKIPPPPPPEPPKRKTERRRPVAKPAPSISPSSRPARKPAEDSPRPALSSVPLAIAPSAALLPVSPLSPLGTVPIGDAATAVGGGAGGQGSGAGHGGGGGRLAGASWIREPDHGAMTAAESPKARSSHINGVAKLACLVDARGKAETCSLIGETPEGYEFGRAAMALYPSFRIRGVRINGKIAPDIPILVTLNFVNQ